MLARGEGVDVTALHPGAVAFAQNLLLMYPEGAHDIVEAAGPALSYLYENERANRLSSSPGRVDDFWGRLLTVPATTPALAAQVQAAQQRFLSWVCGGQDPTPIVDSLFGKVGSGRRAALNLDALARFSREDGRKWAGVANSLARNEVLHLRRAIQAGNLELLEAVLNLGPVPRDLAGDEPSWVRVWANEVRVLPVAGPGIAAAEQALDQLLDRGVDIDQAGGDGRSTLAFLLDTQATLAEDSRRTGQQLGLTVTFSEAEAALASLGRSVWPAERLIERGARWHTLQGLTPAAQHVIDTQPAVRRERLGQRALPGAPSPGRVSGL